MQFCIEAVLDTVIVAIAGLPLRYFMRDRVGAWTLAFIITLFLTSPPPRLLTIRDPRRLAVFFIASVICLLVDVFLIKRKNK
ncbi:MAG TPA: hypothetical protein VK619_03265 [Pyrinomonadaceae bacterium]|nr:hypothetical protein [Pyrinomonadaceae bacterium]